METKNIRFEFKYSKEEVSKMTPEEREKCEYELLRFDKSILSDETREELEKDLEEVYLNQWNKEYEETGDLSYADNYAKAYKRGFERGFMEGYIQEECRLVLIMPYWKHKYPDLESLIIFTPEEIDYICSMREARPEWLTEN